MVRPPVVFGGIATAAMFLWFSLTPSLLPRNWVAQGVVSGIAVAFGYGIGSGISALLRRVLPSEPNPRVKTIAWRVLIGVGSIGTLLMVVLSQHWQNDLRRLIEVDDEPAFSAIGVLFVMLVVSAIVLFGARLVRSFTRFLVRQVNRIVPKAVSTALGVVVVVLLLIGLFTGVLWSNGISLMNEIAGTTNGTTSDGTQKPQSSLRSGGPESLVQWGSLGRQGRDFIGRGPGTTELESFHGPGCCKEPIRVYVGLDSASTAKQRAELAVRELERTGAFKRKVLGVFGATGTGWINPRVADSLEYIHGGDTAEVSIQYSFLPSWLSFLVDQKIAADAGKALVTAVRDRVDQLPADQRPKVLLFGESLGSYATESAFSNIADMRAKSDGALLVGPTFSNPIWKDLVDQRSAGSPQWLPKTSDPNVRFARTPADLDGFGGATPASRIVYLQNSSDPITWWNPELAYRKPDWAGSPAAPDRAPSFRWFPIVTFWQLVGDLTDSVGVPTGFGHHFGSNVVDGWVAVLAPDGWSASDTARLKAVVGERG